MLRSCLHCQFAEDTGPNRSYPELLCRRYPPPLTDLQTGTWGRWIYVRHRDWCGEFRPREKPSTKVTVKARA